ncbi:MAG: hypothetical protein HC896_09170 [Bacteroidales bacterium]|nr:hypothetical protein [Bacteroidales bacterium]
MFALMLHLKFMIVRYFIGSRAYPADREFFNQISAFFAGSAVSIPDRGITKRIEAFFDRIDNFQNRSRVFLPDRPFTKRISSFFAGSRIYEIDYE